MNKDKIPTMEQIAAQAEAHPTITLNEEFVQEPMVPIEGPYQPNFYVMDAMRTLAPMTAELADRASDVDVLRGLFDLQMVMMLESEKLADALKRHVFYGTNNKSDWYKWDRPTNPFEGRVIERMRENGKRINQFHAVLGIVTEAHEILHGFVNSLTRPDDSDADVNFEEELGDLMWYIALGAMTLGHNDTTAIMAGNIRKLRARYPEKFTEERAVERDTDAEIKALKGEQ